MCLFIEKVIAWMLNIHTAKYFWKIAHPKFVPHQISIF